MANSAASELASTLQSAHIDKHPDPSRDLNPSTSSSKRVPVHVTDVERDPRNVGKPNRRSSSASSDPSEVPISILEPLPRTHSNLPPLPDLRFEQSYLASIQTCNSASSVAWITFVDHLIKPTHSGCHLASRYFWMACVAHERQVPRSRCWSQDKTLVVGCQWLEHTSITRRLLSAQ